MEAWPPQVTMLTFRAPVATHSCALIAGTHNSPSLAGVISMTIFPSLLRTAQCSMWACAEVQSKTTSQMAGSFTMASIPRSEIGTSKALARFIPAELKLRPAKRVQVMPGVRITLIIRSVPILPVPMMAILRFLDDVIVTFPLKRFGLFVHTHQHGAFQHITRYQR